MNAAFVVCCDDDDTSLATGEPPLVLEELLRHTDQWNADGYSGDDTKARYVIPWLIDNKYYSADIVLRVLDHKTWTALSKDDAAQAEAYVFLAHKARQASLDAVKKAVETHGVANVSLCVLVSRGRSTTADGAAAAQVGETQLEDFEQFCLDQGVEYVDADAEDETVAEFGRKREAVHRIVDALSSHMWPDMRMKAPSSSSLSTQPSQTPGQPGVQQPAPPTPASQAQAMMIGGINVVDLFAGLDEEDDGLDRAIQAALSLRSQIGTMSDENRRAAAAQVALSFLQRFGDDDDDDALDRDVD